MKSVFAVATVVLITGCATITRGTSDALTVQSSPSGADVMLSNGMTGKTPATFRLPRNQPLTVIVKKEGYEESSANVVPQIVGAGGAGMAGNLIFGGIIGAGVDVASGAMNDLRPNPVYVRLTRIDL